MFKKWLLGAALLLVASPFCFGQGIRIGDNFPISTALTTPGPISTSPASLIRICTFPANAVPCTNLATTFTSITLGTPCSTSTQITLHGTNTCVATTDNFGNWGAWIGPGTYDFTIQVPSGQALGPFTITAGLTSTASSLTGPGSITGTFSGNFTANGIAIFSNAASTFAGTAANATTAVTAGTATSVTGPLTSPIVITNPNSTIVFDGSKYATIQAAINAAASGNATVIVPINSTITTGMTISQPNVTLRCDNGAIITKGASLDMLTVSAAGVTLRDCIYDGVQTSFSGGAINLLAGSSGSTVENNQFKNMKDSTSCGVGAICLNTSSNDVIRNNRMTNINAFGIFAKNNSNANTVDGNYIDTTLSAALSSASDISVHATTAAQSVNDWIITRNIILHGGASFGIEVGDFGGNPAVRTIIANNNVKMAVAGALGCYSVGGTLINGNQHVTVDGNTCDANGFTMSNAGGWHGIELFGDHISAHGNTVNTGAQTLTNLSVIAMDPCSYCVVEGNTIKAALNGTNEFGIQVIAGLNGQTLTNSLIKGNIVDLSTSVVGSYQGIALQCGGNVTNTCTGTTIEGNTVVGANIAGDKGITINNISTGTMNGNVLGPNTVINFNQSFSLLAGTYLATTPTIYNHSGTQQINSVHIVEDTATFAATTVTVTLTGSAVFSSAASFTCWASDTAAPAPIRVQNGSGSSVIFTGGAGAGATDVINYGCIGN